MSERLYPDNTRLPYFEADDVVEQGDGKPPIVRCAGSGVGCLCIAWFKSAKICAASRHANRQETLLCGKGLIV